LGKRLIVFQSYTWTTIKNICGLRSFRLQKNSVTDEKKERNQVFEGPFAGNVTAPKCLCQVTKRDIKFLHAVIKAEDSPVYVAHANLALGFYYKYMEFDSDQGIFHFQTAIGCCDDTLPEQKLQLLPPNTDPFIYTVGDYLACIRKIAYSQVEVCRCYQEKFIRSPADGCFIPGDQCDGCGKKKRDEKLLVCSRCEITYYCSKECQTTHWKADPRGHKQMCRKKGEFRLGDEAIVLVDLEITQAGTHVVLLERRNNKQWLVGSMYNKEKKAVVSEDELRVMAPTEKRFRQAFDERFFYLAEKAFAEKDNFTSLEALSVLLRTSNTK